jgi:hypothetical protein
MRQRKRAVLRALGGSGARDLCEVLTWLVYALAALVMAAAVVGAILGELALRFVAEFWRGLGDGHIEGDTQGVRMKGGNG